jgi:hypothetical protein
MNKIYEHLTVGSHISPRPSPYAISKLEQFEYVELWYFTQEGCADAYTSHTTQAEDTFGFTKVDNIMALRSVSSLRASKNAINDANLTFRQLSMSKVLFLDYAAKAGWPAGPGEHLDKLSKFFLDIECHPDRAQPNGEHVLLTYQARVRRDWHDALKRDQGFDISKFSEDLLRSISTEIWSLVQQEGLTVVSTPLL